MPIVMQVDVCSMEEKKTTHNCDKIKENMHLRHTSIGGHFANAMSGTLGHEDIAAGVHGNTSGMGKAGLPTRSVGI
jgi:hypothetical protein